MNVHNERVETICEICGLFISDAKRLMKHFKSHTDPREDDQESEQITCSLCPSVFISEFVISVPPSLSVSLLSLSLRLYQ